jgi:hypothetical protein
MPGHDGVGLDQPVRIVRPAGTWELGELAIAQAASAEPMP